METPKHTYFETAFPQQPMQAKLGGIILQPGICKMEMITTQLLCAFIANGDIGIAASTLKINQAIFLCRTIALAQIDDFDKYVSEQQKALGAKIHQVNT